MIAEQCLTPDENASMPVKLFLRLRIPVVVMVCRHERGMILYTRSPEQVSFACLILRGISSHGQDRTTSLDILRVWCLYLPQACLILVDLSSQCTSEG